MKDIILIILCIIFYGTATFFKRLGLLTLHPYQLALLTAICYLFAIPFWAFLLNKESDNLVYTSEGVFCVIIYTLFNIIAGIILAFLLKTSTSPGSLIVMVNLSSVITLLLSYLILNEQLNFAKIIAIILALISLILVNL